MRLCEFYLKVSLQLLLQLGGGRPGLEEALPLVRLSMKRIQPLLSIV